MNELRACIFPDAALTDISFVNSVLVYFDSLVLPGIPFSGPDWVQSEIQITFPPNRYEEMRKTRDYLLTLRDLEKEGIIERELPIAMPPSELSEITSTVISQLNITSLEKIPNIVSAAGNNEWLRTMLIWSDDQNRRKISISGSLASLVNLPAQSKVLSYCVNVALLLAEASVRKHNLVTNSYAEYLALIEFQKLINLSLDIPTYPGTFEIIRLALPTLTAKSTEDVIEARSKLKPYLDPFRAEIAKLATTFQIGTSASEMRREAKRIVERDIRPQIVALERFLQSPSKTFQKHLISASDALITMPLTLVGSTLLGMPFEQSIMLTPFIHLLSSSLKTIQERSEKKWENPITFAVLAERRARRK